MEPHEFLHQYHVYGSKRVMFIVACLLISFFVLILNISLGLYDISFVDSYRVLFDHIFGNLDPTNVQQMRDDFIIWEQRLPRAIAAMATGAALGVCGAAMQSSLKNPLADPYTTGISSGASLGVAFAIILGVSIVPFASADMQIVFNAFLFSLIPAAIIILVTRVKKATPTTMILTGVAVMYVFSACTSLIMLIADDDDLAQVYRWNLGNLGSAGWDNIGYIVAAAVIAVIFLTLAAKKLNLLSMDDESAIALGMNPKTVRIGLLTVVSLSTALVVSFTGTIGFVGLVAPHIVRILFGSNNKYLVPASAMFGAMFLILADSVAKVAGPTDLPVGVITSLVGGPLFLYILMRQKKTQWR